MDRKKKVELGVLNLSKMKFVFHTSLSYSCLNLFYIYCENMLFYKTSFRRRKTKCNFI